MANTTIWHYQILQLLFPCLACCRREASSFVLWKIPTKTQRKPTEMVLSSFIYLSLRFLKRDKKVEFPLTYSKSLLICWHSHGCFGGNKGKFSKWLLDKKKMYLWVEETKGKIDLQNVQKVAFIFFPLGVWFFFIKEMPYALKKCMKQIQEIYS